MIKHLLFLIVFVLAGCQTSPKKVSEAELSPWPQVMNASLHRELQVSHKKFYSLACHPQHRVAAWVQFELTSEQVQHDGSLQRWKKSYLPDTGLHGACVVQDKEYKPYAKKGYDRGHLADAESFRHDRVAVEEVAYTSNLSPQKAGFNRGIWKRLELWQREQAEKELRVLVIVGPILSSNLPKLETQISIPEAYYRVIIDLTPPYKAIGFMMRQNDKGAIHEHVVCPDKIEQITGLKFADAHLKENKKNLFANCAWEQWTRVNKK